jgi:hypothetical protein
MDYASYKEQIYVMAGYTVDPTTGNVTSYDQNFETVLPQIINYAELRIQRDLDLLSNQIVNTTYQTTANSEIVPLNPSDFITVQGVSVETSPSSPLLPTTKEYLQYVYPTGSTAGIPQFFAMYGGDTASGGQTQMKIRLGPIPNIIYNLTITGTLHSAPISATNTTTWISTYLPDVFIMASMIYMSAYQRNFGRIADDPQMAQTYEMQYQALLKGATVEEFRKKFQASAWSSMSSSPVATPTR